MWITSSPSPSRRSAAFPIWTVYGSSGTVILDGAVEADGFEDDDRIGIGNRGKQETLGVVWCARRDHLDPRRVDVDALPRLAVVFSRPESTAIWDAKDHGTGESMATPVPDPSDVVDDLVVARRRETHELDLGDGSHTADGEAEGGADDARFRDRSVDDPMRTECFAWRPSVTRKTPPVAPTSSPRSTTDGSASAVSSAAAFTVYVT